MACGASHSVLLSESGEVYTMGENSRGQLGTGSTSSKGVPNPRLVEELTFTKLVEVRAGLFTATLSIEG